MFQPSLAMPVKGYLLAALAAALYGTNPVFAVPLYKMGMNPISVILLRYALGIPPLAILALWKEDGLGLKKSEILPVTSLGVIMAISSIALYESYNFMNPGVASTLLFMYPILTALIMTFFFHEKFGLLTALCLLLMCAGLYLLTISSAGISLDGRGLVLISISALAYAVYLVMIKISKRAKRVPTFRSLFNQLLSGTIFFALIFPFLGGFESPPGWPGWLCILSLAIFPTVLSLVATIRAINYIGPTPTAIFGALEPVTAVTLSIVFLGEAVTLREIAGATLVIIATLLVVAQKNETRTENKSD